MNPGERIDITIDRIGTLSNPVVEETRVPVLAGTRSYWRPTALELATHLGVVNRRGIIEVDNPKRLQETVHGFQVLPGSLTLQRANVTATLGRRPPPIILQPRRTDR